MAKFFISALTFGFLGLINCNGYSGTSAGGNLPDSVNAPIYSQHSVDLNKVAGNIQRHQIPDIVISSGPIAIKMIFESQSTDLDVSQKHQNSDGKTDSSNSQDGEIVMKHSVTKPVVQYIDEEIVPTRHLSQKVLPVKEYVKTIVNRQYANPEPEPKAEPEPEPEPKY